MWKTTFKNFEGIWSAPYVCKFNSRSYLMVQSAIWQMFYMFLIFCNLFFDSGKWNRSKNRETSKTLPNVVCKHHVITNLLTSITVIHGFSKVGYYIGFRYYYYIVSFGSLPPRKYPSFSNLFNPQDPLPCSSFGQPSLKYEIFWLKQNSWSCKKNSKIGFYETQTIGKIRGYVFNYEYH